MQELPFGNQLLLLCEVCGQRYDPAYLDEVIHHLHGNPIPLMGIKGVEVDPPSQE